MKKQIFPFLLITISCFANAQQKNDSLSTRTIEDIKLHKTGNPNNAKISTTKSQLDVMETPQAIAVVTHEVIEQQQAQQLSDVVKNVNGVYITSARGASQDSFGARGYTFGNENIFKNGSRVNSGIFPEVSGLERVEVLKGSTAILYGNVAPGGIVNMVTKKPLFNFGGNIALNYGSWNNIKPTIDIYGALSKNAAFRMNGSYENKDSFRDFVSSEKHYFNPSFLINISDKTQIIVEADYLKHHFTPDFGLGSFMDAKTSVSYLNTELPRNAFIGAKWGYQINEMSTSTITLNHQLKENWQLNSVASYQNYTRNFYGTERIQWTINNTNSSFDRSFKQSLNKTYNEQNYVSFQMNLNGNFKTGNLSHKILVGTDADYSKADAYTFYTKEFGNFASTNFTGSLTYLDNPSTWNNIPQYEAFKKDLTSIPTERFGAYIQDLLDFGKLKFLAGIRFNYLETKARTFIDYKNNQPAVKQNINNLSERAFSPRAGLVYQFDDNFMVFASYANSFSPNNTGSNTDVYGNPLKSSIINQYEIGLKKNLYKNTIGFNLTAYQIDNSNAVITARYQADGITENSDTTKKELAGKSRSQGVELDITGNPTPNLSIIAGTSYNYAHYIETDAKKGFLENERIVRTPGFTGNASVFYTFPKYLKGLKLGGTTFYTGKRLAGWNNTKEQTQVDRIIKMGDFITVDFSVGYQSKKFSIQGKLGNIFDVVDYNVHENYSVNPITPRNFYLTFNYKL